MATMSSTAFPKLKSATPEDYNSRCIEQSSEGLAELHRNLFGSISEKLTRLDGRLDN